MKFNKSIVKRGVGTFTNPTIRQDANSFSKDDYKASKIINFELATPNKLLELPKGARNRKDYNVIGVY